MLKCPKCNTVLEVKLTAAPPMQSGERPTGGEIGQLLDLIDDKGLNAWELEFVKSLRERYEEYGDRIRLSEKQRDILERIVHGE